MTQMDKALKRLLSRPKDYSWGELRRVLGFFGYTLEYCGRTSGSRVIFRHQTAEPITMHAPHPKPILKGYQITFIIKRLIKEGFL